jgi:hypothetical protein
MACPKDALLIDFVLSDSNERIQVCQKKVDGQFLKHGPETIYNSDGTLKSKKYYQLGIESTLPTVQEVTANCPSEGSLENSKCLPKPGIIWKGKYSCPLFQGDTDLLLTMGTDKIRAIFEFTAKKAHGKYFMKGVFDPNTNQLTFEPLEWIEKPETYFMIGMNGIVNFEDHTYKGKMTDGCAIFELKAL